MYIKKMIHIDKSANNAKVESTDSKIFIFNYAFLKLQVFVLLKRYVLVQATLCLS